MKHLLFLPALLLLLNSATGQTRQFPRCPNGYRYHGGVCHTFGYRDHILRYHQGTFHRAAPPMQRQ